VLFEVSGWFAPDRERAFEERVRPRRVREAVVRAGDRVEDLCLHRRLIDERFGAGNAAFHRFACFPFGAGPRKCRG
jgi:hypothetical protein